MSCARAWLEWLKLVRFHYRKMMERRIQRRALRDLDDWQLADVGLTREPALRDSRRWLWWPTLGQPRWPATRLPITETERRRANRE